MSDPCVDLEKGITGLKEEAKAITGLKEQEYKHLKEMCVKGILDVYSVLFFVTAMVCAVSFDQQTHIWLPIALLLPLSIFNFWYCRRMKHAYAQHNTLPSTDGDLSTTLLRNKPTG